MKQFFLLPFKACLLWNYLHLPKKKKKKIHKTSVRVQFRSKNLNISSYHVGQKSTSISLRKARTFVKWNLNSGQKKTKTTSYPKGRQNPRFIKFKELFIVNFNVKLRQYSIHLSTTKVDFCRDFATEIKLIVKKKNLSDL